MQLIMSQLLIARLKYVLSDNVWEKLNQLNIFEKRRE